MHKKERYKAFIDQFKQHLPEPTTELIYDNPFQLLIAVILSAQCTDKRVNKVTPALFSVLPTPDALAYADVEMVLQLIRSISYPNNKAKYIVATARIIVERFHGRIPSRREDLEALPGVGRKTANVMLATVFQKPVVAVDTHVYRVSKRIGLVSEKAKTPRAVEDELMLYLPKEDARHVNHWLVLHGRYTCVASEPACHRCPITHACLFYAILLVLHDSLHRFPVWAMWPVYSPPWFDAPLHGRSYSQDHQPQDYACCCHDP